MPITIERTAGAGAELGLIELQGKLQFEETGGAPRPPVGTFSRDQGDEGKSTIRTGRYRIRGERFALKKPLAVLRKKRRGGEKGAAFELVGAVREKMKYDTRPDPILQ